MLGAEGSRRVAIHVCICPESVASQQMRGSQLKTSRGGQNLHVEHLLPKPVQTGSSRHGKVAHPS